MNIEELVKYIDKRSCDNIFIVGNGSGGKTFLSNALRDYFGLTEDNVLMSDDYLLSSEIRSKIDSSVYNSKSYFLAALNRDVNLAMRKVPFPKIEDYRGITKCFRPAHINIFEGIGMAFVASFNSNALRIFIYTEPDIEWKLREKRDLVIRGISEEVIKGKFTKRRQSFEKEYFQLKNSCDIVIKNLGDEFIIERES